MIDTVTEYYELLERLRDKNFNGKLSKHLQSKLEALQECEELINTLAIQRVSQRSELLLFMEHLSTYYGIDEVIDCTKYQNIVEQYKK